MFGEINSMVEERKDKTFKRALEVAKVNDCYFIEQVVSFLPIAKQTFYNYFPIGSDEMDAIKEILDNNKIATKTKMYNKWFNSDNATLQMGLMKLIGNEEEAHRLNGTSMRVESNTNVSVSPKTLDDWYDKNRGKKDE